VPTQVAGEVTTQLEMEVRPLADEHSTTRHSAAGRFYRPELDGLRFFAFLAVFICHTIPDKAPFYLAHGFSASLAHVLSSVSTACRSGVDLFFLLSAYLITELLLREKAQTGRLRVGWFYLRRVLRIWPLYFLVIGIALGVTLVDKQQHLPGTYVAAYLLLAGNWISAVWGPPASIVMPLWSVSLEEQFYLLWPLVVRKAAARSISLIAVAMIAFSTVSRLIFLHRGWTDGLSQNSFTRLEPIALGILIAVALRGRTPRVRRMPRAALIAVGLVTWMLVRLFCDLNFSVTGTMIGYPLIAVGSAAILIGALGSTTRALSGQIVVHLGKVSYGLYVYHLLGLRISYWIFRGHTAHLSGFAGFCIVGFVLTVLLSLASYEWFEKPFLTIKEKYFTTVRSRPDGASAETA